MAEKLSTVEEKITDPSPPSSEAVSLLAVDQRDADETLSLVEEYDSRFGPPTPKFEKKLRWKLYLHLTVLVTLINLMLFVSFVI
jgi:hypothetical protein